MGELLVDGHGVEPGVDGSEGRGKPGELGQGVGGHNFTRVVDHRRCDDLQLDRQLVERARLQVGGESGDV